MFLKIQKYMNKTKKLPKAVDFQKYLAEKLKNPKIRKYYNEYGKQLEIAYQILQLRKQKRISQAELARKLGTRQSDIARMEAGQQNFTTDTLQKIASVFDRDLKIEFVK
jgi:ribosome-binding protein aMBF1 (putative translation factor)